MNLSKLFLKKISFDNYLINDTSLLYLLALSIFLVIAITRESFLANVVKLDIDFNYKILIIICIVLLALKEYKTQKYKIILFLYLAVIVFLTFIIKNVAHFTTAVSLLYLYSSRDVEYRSIAKVALILTTMMLIIIVGLSYFGVIENYIFQPNTDRPRAFLGFKYALFAPMLYFNVIALALFLWQEKLSIFVILGGTIINHFLYIETDSRMSYYFTFLVIIVALIIKINVPFRFFLNEKRIYINGVIQPLVKLGVVFSYVLCAGVSILISVNYNEKNGFQNKINQILTQRLEYGKKSFDTYGIKLFGQRIPWVGNGLNIYGKASNQSRLYVDNVYLQFLQQYGLVFFVLVICTLTYAMYCVLRKKQWMLIFILLIVALHGVLDDLVLHIWYNTFWLALTPYVFRDKVKYDGFLRIKMIHK